MAFGPSEIPAQRSWMPLRVRFRTDSAMTPTMELHNASSQGLVYRVSKQGRTSLDHPARKESSMGISEHGNF
jgi:hypothetical protein